MWNIQKSTEPGESVKWNWVGKAVQWVQSYQFVINISLYIYSIHEMTCKRMEK